MESAPPYSSGNNSRKRSFSFSWSNSNAAQMLANSSRHEEDDEQALKWAAIEKLPTYDRLRKGLLKTLTDRAIEIDVHDIGFQDRKNLLDRLVKVAEQDNKKFLLKLKARMDRVAIDIPKIEVRFEHLTVEAQAREGSRALPSLFNFFANMLEGVLSFFRILPNRKKQLNVLKDVSGIIKPSRLTLLLGPPGSGKTTLLLALAGKLDTSLKLSGRVTYNGHDLDEFIPQRTAAYISQHDIHIPEMTVRETLAFSAKCQGVGTRYDLLAELLRREKHANVNPDPDVDVYMKAAAAEGQAAGVMTDYVLKVLGLDICADTIVGNEMLRGISGGQKRRVTTGEMIVGPASAMFMDEISTGLDSSTTFQIVNSLKQYVQILEGTAFISLLQPDPETYDLFDDIVLLSDGLIVYQGPRDQVLEFFEFMGFKCPERKGIADFLQEVTSKKDQRHYWVRKDKPYSFVTVNEFAKAFQSFHVGRTIRDELSSPFDKAESHPAALTKNNYGVNKKELLKVCFFREFLLMKRNSFFYIFKFCQLTMLTIFTMTTFLRTEMHRDSVLNGGLYSGALFYISLKVAFNGMGELPLTVNKLPVFYKQRDLRFFPAWAYALPTWILTIPITFVEVAILTFISYYVIGFDPNVGRLIKQYLLLILLNQMASGFFRCMAAVGRNIIVANTIGWYILMLFVILGGFVVSRDDIKKGWIWGYWISPLMYGQNALVVNEFLGHSWSHVQPNSIERLGIEFLKSRGYFTGAYWYWLGVGAVLGFTVVYNVFYILALTFLNAFDKPQASTFIESQELETDQTARSSPNNSKKRIVIPFEPHSMAFDEIVYSVDLTQEMRNEGVNEDKLVLLNGITGAFRPGVLTALMGVSGAGKTTLMDVLASRKTGGYIKGNIMISGYTKKQETFARISGYCEQNDIHSPYITVYESLVFSAWLRLPSQVDAKTKEMFIEEVMEHVELNPIRESIVGLPGVSGLSTEQRKRLTIAVELVANPSIIFMDEPTSGLDARAAAIVMRTVRNTVDTGRTVVCTIHQPSIDIFEAFDELFLLKRGGKEIYVGPLGRHSCHLINYFEGIEGVSKIKDGYNPATWMLEVSSSAQEAVLGVDFSDIYKNSELYRMNKALVADFSNPSPGSKDLHFSSQYSLSIFGQFLACLWKQHLSYWRNPPYNAVRFIFTIFTSLFFGTMFLNTKLTKEQDLFNALSSLGTAVLFLGIHNASSAQPIVAVERTVFYREKGAGMYSAFPFAFAQVVIEIPYILVQSVVYGLIVYAMSGYEWSAAKFFWYLYFLYFTLLYFTFYGMMVVAVSPNHQIATIISTAFYALWNLFSGFIIPRPRTPVWWRWYCWINPLAWTLYGLIASQFGDVKVKLESGTVVEEFVTDYFGFKHDFVGVVAVIILGFVIVFIFTFAFAIKSFDFQRR